MKSILMALVLVSGALAHAETDLDILRGNNLELPTQVTQDRPSSLLEVERQVEANIKQKCSKNGCVVYVDDAAGHEFRVGAKAGVGNTFGNQGGIAIIDASGSHRDNQNDLNYGVEVSFVSSKVTCRHMIPESVFRYIETYIRYISTPEFAAKVMKKAEVGEDMPMPEPIKLAFMTLATVKPSQGQCEINGRGR
ncbi:MAG: hypothetical protein V4692_14410 [Bdellovibrionota bacterium]